MARAHLRYAAVDLGSNSTRLLVAEVDQSGVSWLDRRTTVTGMGKGVDQNGFLSHEAMARTLDAVAGYATAISGLEVAGARAVATSAARDASNGGELLDGVESVLGFRPEIISGNEEAALSFIGATRALEAAPPYIVIDIGGGSTEVVFGADEPDHRLSLDIGSVRLTDRVLRDRPSPESQLSEARDLVADVLNSVTLPSPPKTAVGVAGTFTALSAISQDLPAYDPGRVHGSKLPLLRIAELVLYLATLTLEETKAIPSLDPARAPVILAGAVVAEEAVRRTGLEEITVSEHDLLDGIVLALSAIFD